jgi:predicted dehydrogenase
MPGDKIRVGLIGANANYGWSRRAHLPALLALPEYELTAVCTAHKGTAEESARQYGARLAFHNYHQMVTHPEVDLVSVSVRVPLHHSMVMAALKAGKHVFCEWPLGMTLAQAEEMASLARARGVCHMVGLQARGDPALLHLRDLLAGGYVGDVLACNMTMFLPGVLERDSSRAWMADGTKGGHSLSIATGHSIDVVCFCVAEFNEVSARVATQVKEWRITDTGGRVKVTAPDNVLVSGALANGAVASVHVATVPWHGTGWRMEVYGREGTIVASSQLMVQYAQIRLLGGRGQGGALEELKVPEGLTAVPTEVPAGEPFNVAQLYRRLSTAILGKGKADPDFDLAVRRHRLLDALQRSSSRGEMVAVAVS